MSAHALRRHNPSMKVLTIPNVISFSRLLGVPLLIWLAWTGKPDGAILAVFAYSSITDFLDGWLARKLNQYSDLGAFLDPLADRLYIVASLVVLLIRELVPVWVVVVIVAREAVMGVVLAYAQHRGYATPAVHYLGKAGTMMLLWSIPLLFLGDLLADSLQLVRWFALAFLAWGVVTYWVAGLMYFKQYWRAWHA